MVNDGQLVGEPAAERRPWGSYLVIDEGEWHKVNASSSSRAAAFPTSAISSGRNTGSWSPVTVRTRCCHG